jgi:hypothetical protein
VDKLETKVHLLDGRVSLVTQPNLPIDPNYRNHVLEDHQSKFERLLPMESDEMIFAFEKSLEISAFESIDKGAPDRVGFLTRFLN